MSYFLPVKYEKKETSDPFFKPVNKYFFLRFRVIPIISLVLATFLLFSQILVPLVFFTTQDETTQSVETSALGKVSGFSEFEFKELTENTTNSTPVVLGKSTLNNNYDDDFFYLTIPKLNIIDAKVEINAPTLSPDKAIGHYKGSGMPGEINKNMLLYGHSVLPAFYNPKNYKTIFSTLHRLEPGDLIYINNYKGKSYTYKVEKERILKPDVIDPLAPIKPKYLNDSTLTLLTCSPPGTKINRLLIDAVLVEI